LRNENPILSSAPKEAVEFIRTADDVQIAFRISGLKAAAGMKTRLKRPPGDMFVVLNGSPEKMAVLDLPEGTWEILADGEKVPARGAPVASKKTLQVPPTSGIVLRKTK
jgi:hypothetical protein